MPKAALGVLILLFLLAAAELAVLVKVAGAVGVLGTLALLIGVGLLGAQLARRQGMDTLRRVSASMQAGRMPVADLFDTACIMAAGLLLALPGFISDVAAIVLLLPPVRRLLYKALARRLPPVAAGAGTAAGGFGTRPRPAVGRGVIEGEYEEIESLPDRPERR